MEEAEGFNDLEQNLNKNKLLLLILYLLNCIKALIDKVRPMEKLLNNKADTTKLSWFEKKEASILFRPDIINHIEFNSLPTLEELKDMALTGHTLKLQKIFFDIQQEYNHRATKLKSFVKEDLIKFQWYLKQTQIITSYRCAIPPRENYLQEMQEELSRAKKDLQQIKKTHKKNSNEVKAGEKEINRLEAVIKLTISEIAELKESIPKMKTQAVKQLKEHYDKVILKQREWNNLLCVLYNWIYLEDQWRIACEKCGIGEFAKIFKETTFKIDKDTHLFLCLSGGYYGDASIEILRRNYGKLEHQAEYTEDSDRQTLTLFDETDKYRKGAMKQITKPNNHIYYSNVLDSLKYMQTALNEYNQNAKNNYTDFQEIDDKSTLLKWFRDTFGFTPNFSPDEPVPNKQLTNFVLPTEINRIDNPYNNPDITHAQYQYDHNQNILGARQMQLEEENYNKAMTFFARSSPSIQAKLIELSHDASDEEIQNMIGAIKF